VLRDKPRHGSDNPRAVGAGNGQSVVVGHCVLPEMNCKNFNGYRFQCCHARVEAICRHPFN